MILNFIGLQAATILKLPGYLDTSGTIFVAAALGYLPGIAVGFLTNLIKYFAVDPSEIYFSLISIVIAIISAYFSKKGFFENLKKLLPVIILIIFVSVLLDFFIYDLIDATNYIENIMQTEFEHFCQVWAKYPGAVAVWQRNFSHVEQLFNYPSAVRKIMYTTNAIEAVNSGFRKVTKRGSFPNEDSVFKVLYLRVTEFYRKWAERPVANWALLQISKNTLSSAQIFSKLKVEVRF